MTHEPFRPQPRSPRPLDGVIVIDKPAGMTSAAVVAKVKAALRVKRVGHTGTLDPMATGVLPLCLGEATKIAGYLLAEDKTYEAEIELGASTDTLDAEGRIIALDRQAAALVTEAMLRQVMTGFLGAGAQVPPMYSALKHQGKRLHELARAGQTVAREPRPIHIHELTLLSFESPRARFRVHCSKGTYVRTLAADIGERLGCGAHLSALRRTRSGAFTLAHAVPLTAVTDSENREPDGEPGGGLGGEPGMGVHIIDMVSALGHLPSLTVPEVLLERVENGMALPWSEFAGDRAQPAADAVIRLLRPNGTLLALASVEPLGQVQYRRVFKAIRLPT